MEFENTENMKHVVLDSMLSNTVLVREGSIIKILPEDAVKPALVLVQINHMSGGKTIRSNLELYNYVPDRKGWRFSKNWKLAVSIQPKRRVKLEPLKAPEGAFEREPVNPEPVEPQEEPKQEETVQAEPVKEEPKKQKKSKPKKNKNNK